MSEDKFKINEKVFIEGIVTDLGLGDEDEPLVEIEIDNKYYRFKSTIPNKSIECPQKPIVSKVAIEYYEKYKNSFVNFEDWFSDLYDPEFEEEFSKVLELQAWLYDTDDKISRQRELALATLIVNGVEAVEVEKEKLYRVPLKHLNSFMGQQYLSSNVHSKGGFYANSLSSNLIQEFKMDEIPEEYRQWAEEVK